MYVTIHNKDQLQSWDSVVEQKYRITLMSVFPSIPENSKNTSDILTINNINGFQK